MTVNYSNKNRLAGVSVFARWVQNSHFYQTVLNENCPSFSHYVSIFSGVPVKKCQCSQKQSRKFFCTYIYIYIICIYMYVFMSKRAKREPCALLWFPLYLGCEMALPQRICWQVLITPCPKAWKMPTTAMSPAIFHYYLCMQATKTNVLLTGSDFGHQLHMSKGIFRWWRSIIQTKIDSLAFLSFQGELKTVIYVKAC